MKTSAGTSLLTALVAIAVAATVFAWNSTMRDAAAKSYADKALASLAPDLRRLDAYEAAEAAFDAELATAGGIPRDAASTVVSAGIAAPSAVSSSAGETDEGWKTVTATLRWDSIRTEAALAAVSALATSTPPWRIERLVIEPKSGTDSSSLDIVAVQPAR